MCVILNLLVNDGEEFGERLARGGRLCVEMYVRPRRIGGGQNGRASSAYAVWRTAPFAPATAANASPLSVGCQSNDPPRASASFSQSWAR